MDDYSIIKENIEFSLDKEKVTRVLELEELTIILDLLLAITNVEFNEINPNYNQKPLQTTIAYLSGLQIGTDLSEKVEVMKMIY